MSKAKRAKSFFRCVVCDDAGLVNCEGSIEPCPQCNPDSGYEGNYLADLQRKRELKAQHT